MSIAGFLHTVSEDKCAVPNRTEKCAVLLGTLFFNPRRCADAQSVDREQAGVPRPSPLHSRFPHSSFPVRRSPTGPFASSCLCPFRLNPSASSADTVFAERLELDGAELVHGNGHIVSPAFVRHPQPKLLICALAFRTEYT